MENTFFAQAQLIPPVRLLVSTCVKIEQVSIVSHKADICLPFWSLDGATTGEALCELEDPANVVRASLPPSVT